MNQIYPKLGVSTSKRKQSSENQEIQIKLLNCPTAKSNYFSKRLPKLTYAYDMFVTRGIVDIEPLSLNKLSLKS